MSTATMAKPKSISQCLEELKAMESFSDKPELIGSPSLGDVIRQGDIYLTCVAYAEGKATKNRQLTDGSTQGSRHILEGDVEIFEVASFKDVHPTLVGPAFKCVGDVTLTHPEHGWKILPAGTCWQVTYQVAFAEEVRRVRD